MYVVRCVVDGAKTTVDVRGRSSRDLATQSAADASRSPGAVIAQRNVTFSEGIPFPTYVNVQPHSFILNSKHVHTFYFNCLC